MKLISFLFLAILLVGCSTYSEENLNFFDTEITNYIDSTNLDMIRHESGMYYQIIEEGTGKTNIKLNDQVKIYYTGYILGEDEFQSIEKEDALTFGVKELIVGWQEALQLIKENGKIKIIIPPTIGYGTNDTELVPRNSILLFNLGVAEVI